MKTYALVPEDAIMHATDFMEHAKSVQADAAAGGTRLILVKPLDTIIDVQRPERRRRGGGPETRDLWSMLMAALDELKAAVAKNTTVVASTVTLLAGLSEKIKSANANNDPTISALAAEINAEADKLGAAIAANTVAADERATNPGAPPGDPTADLPADTPPA